MPHWRAYRLVLRKGDPVKIQAALEKLNRTLGSEEARRAFWAKALPAASHRKLRILHVCEQCKGSLVCRVCKGKKKCHECDGRLKCRFCGGKGKTMKECERCICKKCKGLGSCSRCLAEKKIDCAACGAKGSIPKTRSVDCKRCKGAGKLLAGGMGGDNKRLCPACKGKGAFEQRYRSACAKCGGTGRLACTVCRSSGKCPSCRGRKRLPDCMDCGDTGTVVKKCESCFGTGDCGPCQGWGKCVECEGTGHCDVCAGSGLRKVAEFPVSVKWLLRDVGCIVEDAGAYTIDGKSIDDINEDTGAGNVAAADCVRLARDNAVLPIGRGTNEIVCISEGQQHSWIAKSVLK